MVATGGSAVYGERAMRHLREMGTVVYLKLGEKTIENRLKNIVLRGVVMRRSGETVADLYAERVPLYEKYAHIAVDCEGKTAEETVRALAEAVREYRSARQKG